MTKKSDSSGRGTIQIDPKFMRFGEWARKDIEGRSYTLDYVYVEPKEPEKTKSIKVPLGDKRDPIMYLSIAPRAYGRVSPCRINGGVFDDVIPLLKGKRSKYKNYYYRIRAIHLTVNNTGEKLRLRSLGRGKNIKLILETVNGKSPLAYDINTLIKLTAPIIYDTCKFSTETREFIAICGMSKSNQ